MPGIKIYKSNNVASRSMVGEKTVQYTDGAGDTDDASDMRQALGLGGPLDHHDGTGSTGSAPFVLCNSATPFSLTVTDGTSDGYGIEIVNKGSATVTLLGKINTLTAVDELISGESVSLRWDSVDDEWI